MEIYFLQIVQNLIIVGILINEIFSPAPIIIITIKIFLKFFIFLFMY